MREYLRMLWDLWVVSSAIGMTALVPFTVAALAFGLIWGPRADPGTHLRLSEIEAQLRRAVILAPSRGVEVGPADRIPPQSLPIPVRPIPEAK